MIWGGIIYLLLPLLAQFYGMEANPYFRTGVIVGLVCLLLLLVMFVFTQAFESTEKAGMGLLYSCVPDSVIYPVMLALLLPVMGHNAIWIAFKLNALPFLLVLYLIRSIRQKNPRLSMDRLLMLDESIRDHVPMLDISIRADNTDVTGISSQIHRFLLEENASERTAYRTALCLEELAADFVAHTMQEGGKAAERDIMDIKLFADGDVLQIIIRNIASRYNPLNFELDDQTFAKVGVKMVQKIARRIDYNYVYRMSIVTIELETKQ